MSEKKHPGMRPGGSQAFTNPSLSRWAACLIRVLRLGLILGIVVVLGKRFEVLFGLMVVLAVGLMFAGFFVALGKGAQDRRAWRQLFRHQRRRQRQWLEEEWANVPDGAISRAPPPEEPEPTQASLSRAEETL
jgi:hypothetical protein